MAKDIFYVPVLKWKKGERDALMNLSPNDKKSIMPLIQIVDGNKSSNFLEELDSVFSYPVYLDTTIAEGSKKTLLKSILKGAKEKNRVIYPVVSPSALRTLSKETFIHWGRFALKVPFSKINTTAKLQKILGIIKARDFPGDFPIDIIIEMKTLSTYSETGKQLKAWRSLLDLHGSSFSIFSRIIICSNSFPDSLSFLSAGESTCITRFEFILFNSLYTSPEGNEFKNKLIFSDLGVSKYIDYKIDFSKLRYGILPKIKYTTANSYYIFKGRNYNEKKRHTKIGSPHLARALIKKPFYYGADFSFGDGEIYKRANGTLGPGNHKTWVTIGVNHHISAVLKQLREILE